MIVKVQRATDDPVAMNRFQREAAVMLRLRHPSIVTLYAFHEGNPAALVMEYVSGQTLAALVAADGRLTPARTAQLIEEIAAALDCVHALGIVHRDVKPSNILIPRHGPAKLTDFGVARIDDDAPLTVMGDILGTIEYASPEQVHGNGSIDTRSDVYSLAAVTYFALTGTPPFRAADNSTQAQLSVMHRQVFAEPPPLRLHRADLTPAMEEAVLRGLAKAPDARYDSAGQLAAALRAAVVAASGEPQQGAMEASSRRTGALAGALAAAALLLAGFALWKTGGLTPPRATPPTVAQKPAATAQVAQKPVISGPLAIPAQSARPKPVLPKPITPPVAHPAHPLIAAVPAKPHPAIKIMPAMPLHKASLIALTPRPRTPKRPVLTASLVRRPVLISAPKPVHVAVHLPAAPPKKGWLLVFAKQNVAGLGRPDQMAGIPAQTVTIDGKAAPGLAAGHWLSVPPGRHLLSFYPKTQSGFGPRTRVPITVGPGAYVKRQVLLARAVSPTASLAARKVAAAIPPPSPVQTLVPASSTAAASVGWYTVSGWIALADQTLPQKAQVVRASALWIKVDGRPFPALALGQWAQLTAGKHLVTFQPSDGLGVGPKTWAIDLAPSAHLNQQIPLPSAPLPAIPPHLRNP